MLAVPLEAKTKLREVLVPSTLCYYQVQLEIKDQLS